MKSPQDRYENDPMYAHMVKALTSMIHQAQFTPSELREMVIFACIKYETEFGMRNYMRAVPSSVNDAFRELDKYRKQLDADREKERLSHEKADGE